MKALVGVLVLGLLAPIVQGAAASFLPPRACPDLGLLLVIGLGLVWRNAAGGLVLAALLGYATDILSGALLGQHALLRILAFGVSRAASGRLNLRGPLPQAVFAAAWTPANAFALAALTGFFSAAVAPDLSLLRASLPQAVANALFAPLVVRMLERVVVALGDEDPRRLLPLEPRRRAA